MLRSSTAWLAGGLAVIALTLAALWMSAVRRADRQAQENATLSQRLEILEQGVSNPPVSRSRSPAQTQSSSFPGASSAPQSLTREMVQGVQDTQTQWKAVEAAFAREPRNPQWGGSIESSLLGVTRDPVMDAVSRPQDMDIDCRSRTCKVSATFPTRSAAEDWAQIYIVSAGRTLPRAHMQVLPNDDGTAEVRIYGSP